MKRIAIAAMGLLAFCLSVFADQSSYSYDNAGNRVKREIVLQKNASPEMKRKIFFSESLAEKEIKIYPNPTYGDLSVEIKGYEESDDCVFRIYNTAGQLILSEKAGSATTGLNISTHPSGIYFLRIILNGDETSWKIIKK